jgi:hypothetical protein
MNKFTRREILQLLGLLFPAILLGFLGKDIFDEDLVCVHIFQPAFRIPEPLLIQYRNILERNKFRNLFHVGIPELLLQIKCSHKGIREMRKTTETWVH